ncbi:DUF202 domain-containing protein [Candidatus Dependentiae bacterium]|nr:DUF202 domain-containing protein [Candidatus Dependentiae bacterium]
MENYHKPYSKFDKSDLILRDHLAIDRTKLANERTYLAYIRTSLTFFISGVSFLKFFDQLIMHITGWIFIPLGIYFYFFGLYKYLKLKKNL